MNANEERLNKLSKQIIGCAFAVANALGQGFLEKVYENSLALELRSRGIGVDQQHDVIVKYRATEVGHYTVDIIVENAIIIELKAAKSIDPAHTAQCLNYLKATGLRMCLLINFGGPRVEVKRIVLNL
jgi:GxxExxY protein